jgi:pimeloyl-ACP methyl ester carboxylesterase
VLQAAEQLGWQRFSLLGHSLGAIISVFLAAALPDRIERLALIDGLMPPTGEAAAAPQQLGKALQAHLRLQGKSKPVYQDQQQAVRARMSGAIAVTQDAAELLAQRGLVPVPGGYTWRSDNRLTLPSALRITEQQALAFVEAIRCPTHLVVASQGLLARHKDLLESLPLCVTSLAGGHHLHLNDEAGADAVADCFNRFFSAP